MKSLGYIGQGPHRLGLSFMIWMVCTTPLFQLLIKENRWNWGVEEQNVYDLCKQVWTQAPVQAHTISGLPYHVYSNACDFALAAILQQVQPIKIKDLHGTKTYKLLEHAFKAGEPIPDLVTHLSKENSDIPSKGEWEKDFEDTIL